VKRKPICHGDEHPSPAHPDGLVHHRLRISGKFETVLKDDRIELVIRKREVSGVPSNKIRHPVIGAPFVTGTGISETEKGDGAPFLS